MQVGGVNMLPSMPINSPSSGNQTHAFPLPYQPPDPWWDYQPVVPRHKLLLLRLKPSANWAIDKETQQKSKHHEQLCLLMIWKNNGLSRPRDWLKASLVYISNNPYSLEIEEEHEEKIKKSLGYFVAWKRVWFWGAGDWMSGIQRGIQLLIALSLLIIAILLWRMPLD